jgi:hypothetical protein
MGPGWWKKPYSTSFIYPRFACAPPPPLLNLDQVHLSRVRIAKQQLDPSLPLCIWTIFFQTSRSINKQFYLW